MNTQSISMEQLFEKLGYNINQMPIGELIDVSNKNFRLKSYDEQQGVVASKILGIIRKADTDEYIIETADSNNKFERTGSSLFSGSPEHRLFVKISDHFDWKTLQEIAELENCIAFDSDKGLLISVRKTGQTIPIVDVEMENGCYFSENILSHNTGGRALKFYASVRLDIRRIGAIKDGEQVIGNRTKVKVVKNKCAPPFKEAEFDIIFSKGISREGDLVDLAVNHGIVLKSGAWYSYAGNHIGQGRTKSVQFIKENADVQDLIREEVKEKLKVVK